MPLEKMLAATALGFATICATAEAQTLVKFASLPAATFESGPTSGQLITAANGVRVPFTGQQPVQGFSSILRTSNGDFLAMSDNGFGAKANSADYVLRVYRIDPDFRTAQGGSGVISVESFIELSDPEDLIPFPIVAEMTNYPGTTIPVDARIQAQRLLTGGDFDIESMRMAHDGTLWFGDEFGPFLLHTDAEGRLLEAPISLPGVISPDNPLAAPGSATIGSSRGFEGMAISPDGKTLYPMLEGTLRTDPDPLRLIISEFDVRTSSYTGTQWSYRLERAGNAIGDLTAVTKDLFLVIERDNAQGAAAAFKRIYLVDLRQVENGYLVKYPVADLLNIRMRTSSAPARPAGPSPSRSRPLRAGFRSASARSES